MGAVGRERARALGFSFYMFSSPWATLYKLGSASNAVLPEVLTLVLGPFFDLPLFYFCRLSLLCLLKVKVKSLSRA